MANLTESSIYETGVYQLETSDPVIAGPSGIANQQAKQLANRTKYLKYQVDVLQATQGGFDSITILSRALAQTLEAKKLTVVTGFDTEGGVANLVLPSATTAGAGASIRVTVADSSTTGVNFGPVGTVRGILNIVRAGSDQILNKSQTGVTSVSLINGESIQLVSNGTNRWQVVNDFQTGDVSPVGLVSYFAKSTAPSGWLSCNGAAISRTTYANLFAAITTTYGVGDGSTTFNLPDLRGEFIRGWDNGRGIDTDSITITGNTTNASVNVTSVNSTSGLTVGMAVSGTGIAGGTTIATIVSETAITLSANATATNSGVSLTFSRSRTFGSSQSDMYRRHQHYNASMANIVNGGSPTTATIVDHNGAAASNRYALTGSPSGGAETRPRNVAMLPMIKF